MFLRDSTLSHVTYLISLWESRVFWLTEFVGPTSVIKLSISSGPVIVVPLSEMFFSASTKKPYLEIQSGHLGHCRETRYQSLLKL